MATKETVIGPDELMEVVRDAVSGMAGGGSDVDFFGVMEVLAVKKKVHCEKDELLAILASLCPTVLAMEVSTNTDGGILVRFIKF